MMNSKKLNGKQIQITAKWYFLFTKGTLNFFFFVRRQLSIFKVHFVDPFFQVKPLFSMHKYRDMLDFIDTSVLDFIIGNADRHNYQSFEYVFPGV